MKLALFLILSHLLAAEIPSSSISSEHASYDGNTLILKGDVKLQHSLGNMQAGSAQLVRESKDGPFAMISLFNNVLISLNNHGKISCNSAEIDFSTLKGRLLSSLGGMIRCTNLHPTPLVLASKQADLEFLKELDTYKVIKIHADDTVQLQYGADFFVKADHAIYSNENPPFIYATPCSLTHFEDQIEAEKIELFPDTSTIVLFSPHGKLKSSAFSESSGLDFECHKLIWEKTPQILTLFGNITVKDAALGEIRCDEEMEFRPKLQDGKWILSNIKAKGKTELNYQLNENFKHLLICYGQMNLDQDRLVITLVSPIDQPIEYFHNQIKLNSNQAELDYKQGKHSIQPQRLLLSGDVRLAVENDALRCGVADQFAYFPEDQKMILSSQNGKHVLFWDEQKQLSIVAQEVHISKSEKGENVKGVGDVRFVFSSTENTLLKKLFPFYHPIAGVPHE